MNLADCLKKLGSDISPDDRKEITVEFQKQLHLLGDQKKAARFVVNNRITSLKKEHAHVLKLILRAGGSIVQEEKPKPTIPEGWETIPGSGGSIRSPYGNYIISGTPGEYRLTEETGGHVIGGTFTDQWTAAKRANQHWIETQRGGGKEELEVLGPADIGTADNFNVPALSEHFLRMIDPSKPPLNKVKVQKAVADLLETTRTALLKNPEYKHKQVEEAFEYAIVKKAREIIGKGASLEETYKQLKELYDWQPNLGTRTSTSVKLQEYSTPIHLAYLMQRMVGITPSTKVYEPTAGNGALVTTAKPKNVMANEIDSTRKVTLADQGFKVSAANAEHAVGTGGGPSRTPVAPRSADVVIANPPFGGGAWKEIDGYSIKMLEHKIVMNALEAMKNRGKAAFIIGNKNFRKGKLPDTERIFLNWLHKNYNVIRNIQIPGPEYARQGTKFPVRLIVVHGRRPGNVRADVFASDEPSDRREYQSVKSVDELVDETRRVLDGRETGLVAADGSMEILKPAPEIRFSDEEPPAIPGTKPARLPGALASEGGRPGGGVPGAAGEEGAVPPSGELLAGAGVPTGAGHGAGGAGAVHGGAGLPTPEHGGVRTPAPHAGGNEPSGVQGAGALPERGAGQRPKPGRGGRGSKGNEPAGAAGTHEPGLAEVTPTELLDLFDEGVREQKQAEPQEKQPEEKTPAESAKEHAKATAKYLKDLAKAAKEINELLGEEGEILPPADLDVAKWNKIKAVLNDLWQSAVAAAKSAKEFVSDVIKLLGEKGRKYFAHWLQAEFPKLQADLAKTTEGDVKPVQFEETITEYQATYHPKSNGRIIDETLTPRTMRDALEKALDNLEVAVGDIDDYVTAKLKYPDKEALFNALSADQIDAVALSIYNLEQHNAATIIGDQTGVGKGRIAASMYRYARLQGAKPIFFTEKGNLFSDFYRDMTDIGGTINPYIMASDKDKGSVTNKTGQVVLKPLLGEKRKAMLRNLAATGVDALAGYDGILTTYSQINIQGSLAQMAIAQVVQGNYIILDESHNASGTESNTGEFLREALHHAKGVIYLSATYAKRADTIPIYFRTDLSRTNLSMDGLIDAVTNGGTPLQEITSAYLAERGQLVRREKSFKGISPHFEVDTKNRASDEAKADQMTQHMRDIIAFDNELIAAIKALTKKPKGAKGKHWAPPPRVFGVPIPGSVIQGGHRIHSTVTVSNFASTVHNAVRALLVCMKAKAGAEQAIKEIKAGRKPIIAISNTMGSFLKEQIEDVGIMKIGDPIGSLTFSDILQRYLARTLYVSVKGPGDRKATRYPISLDDLPGPLKAEYERIEKNIANTMTDIPGSPIDYLLGTLRDAGYRFAEITGRDYVGDLEQPDMPLRKRSSEEINDRNSILREFNNGPIDGLIINRAASAGVSAHSSPEFKDQRPRSYVGIQPELNVDHEVQKMGRINRKGQVNIPRYVFLQLDLPAEIRPTAILIKKMRSLSANTSANSDSPLAQLNVPDIMNKYGDEIVSDWLQQNSHIADEIGVDAGNVNDIAVKATGKIALLPIAEQRRFYEEVETAYNAYIQRLKEEGIYDLQVDDLDFKARTISTTTLTVGTDESNPFGKSTRLEELRVVSDKKPYKAKRIQRMLDALAEAHGGSLEQYTADMLRDLKAVHSDYLSEKEQQAARQKDQAAARRRLDGIKTAMARVEDKFRFGRYPVGGTYEIKVSDQLSMRGVLIAIDAPRPGRAVSGNPAALGNISLVFVVDNALQRYPVSLSKIEQGETRVELIDTSIAPDWDERMGRDIRVKRFMITGNLIQGFADTPKGARIVRFTMENGTTREGILLPLSYSPPLSASRTVRVTKDLVNQFLSDHTLDTLSSPRINLQWRPADELYTLRVPRSKKLGGVFFLDETLRDLSVTGEFETVGKFMQAHFPESAREALVERLYELGEGFSVPYAVYAASGHGTPEPEGGPTTTSARPAPPQEITTQDIQDAAKAITIAAGIIRKTLPPSLWDNIDLRIHPTLTYQELLRLTGNAKQLERSLQEHGGRLDKLYGAATVNNMGAIVRLSQAQTPEDFEGTAYHEAFHVVAKWLIPDKDYAALMDFYKGNEEAAANDFSRFARANSAKELNGKPSFIKRIFAMLNRIIRAIKARLGDKGARIAQIFDNILNQNYEPLSEAEKTARHAWPQRETRYRRDKGYEPKKTVTAYKQFRILKSRPGELFPLFIGKATPVPMDEWLEAKYIPTKGYAPRPGWHAGELPIAPHLRQKSTGKINEDRVWVEVEMPADRDWQAKADATKTGDLRGAIPKNGFYRFKTNKMQGGAWMIGGAIKVKRILSDSDVYDVLKSAGYSDKDIRPELKGKQLPKKDQAQWGVALAKAREKAPPLYSKLIRLVEANKETMPTKPQSILNWLKKNQVKPAELKWMDVEGWLKENAGKHGKVDRDELAAYLRSNEIHLTEITRQGEENRYPELFYPADIHVYTYEKPSKEKGVQVEGITAEYFGNMVHFSYFFEAKRKSDTEPWLVYNPNQEGWSRTVEGSIDNVKDFIRHFVFDEQHTPPGTVRKLPAKFPDWTVIKGSPSLRAEKGYKELLFTLPIEYTHGETYTGSHWAEPNVLFHARIFDNITTPQGDKVFYVDEVQSDWLQQAKKEGFTRTETQSTYHLEPTREGIPGGGGRTFMSEQAADDALTLALDRHNRARPAYDQLTPEDYMIVETKTPIKRGVATAPFLESWPTLAMKRMLRHAVEKGVAYMAWSTGSLQADRYSLAKYINSIHYIRRKKGGKDLYEVYVKDKKGDVIQGLNRYYTEEQLAETFGKEIAKKIVATADPLVLPSGATGKVREIKGVDLVVGGEGMREFYDRQLVNFMKKYTKQWGGKVRQIPIVTKPKERQIVHAVKITPEMREDVLYTGQTMFRPAPKAKDDLKEWATKYIADTMKNASSPGATKEDHAKAERLKEEQWHMRENWNKDLKDSMVTALKHYRKIAKTGWQPERPDTTFLERLLQSPEFYFEKVPAAQRVLEARLAKPENFRQHLADITENDKLLEDIKALKKSDPAEYERYAKLITDADQRKSNLSEADLKEMGFSDQAVKAWTSYRQIMNHGFDKLYAEMLDIIQSYEKVGLEVPSVVTWVDGKKVRINLKVALAMMGDMRGYYAPRIRKPGKWMIVGRKKGAHPHMEFRDTIVNANLLHAKLAKQGYIVRKSKAKNIPEDVFEMAGQTIALGAMVNAAFERVASQKGPTTLDTYGLKGELVETPTGPDYQVRGPFNKRMTTVFKAMGGKWYAKDQAWHFKNPGKGFEERLTNALSNMMAGIGPYDTEPLFAYSIATELANIVKGRGFRSRMIKRNEKTGIDVWEGYETDPLTAAAQYAASIAAGMAKKEMASAMTKAVTGTDIEPSDFDSYEDYLAEVKARRIDPASQRNIFHDVKVYMEETLRNQEFSDRVIGLVKAITVFKYLGFRVASPAVNLTALATSVPAALNEYVGLPLRKAPALLANAIGYFMKYRFGDRTKLKPEINAMFDNFEAKGWTEAQFKNEALAVLQSRVGAATRAVLDWSMFMFGATEKLNRASTLAAAYLAARDAGRSVEDSFKIAKKVSDRAHGIYMGNAALPHYAQGQNIFAKMAKMFYVFSKFSHTYLQTMYEIGWKRKNRKALLYMMFAPAVIAGAGGMVGWSLLMAVAKKILGVDDPEEAIYNFLAGTFGSWADYLARFGLMGLLGWGVSLKGSLQIDMVGSVPTTIPELLGAPGSIYTDTKMATQSAARGQWGRAAERFLPSFAAAPIKAAREYREGVTTTGGVPKLLHGKKMMATPLDTVYRSLSFNPAHMAAQKEKKWSETKLRKSYSQRRGDIYARLRAYYSVPPERRSRAVYEDILMDIKEYNDRVRAGQFHKKGVSFITSTSISRALKVTR